MLGSWVCFPTNMTWCLLKDLCVYMFPPLKVGDKNLDLETSDMGVYTESWEEMIQFLLMSIFFWNGWFTQAGNRWSFNPTLTEKLTAESKFDLMTFRKKMFFLGSCYRVRIEFCSSRHLRKSIFRFVVFGLRKISIVKFNFGNCKMFGQDFVKRCKTFWVGH